MRTSGPAGEPVVPGPGLAAPLLAALLFAGGCGGDGRGSGTPSGGAPGTTSDTALDALADGSSSPASGSLRILSYNVHGLPPAITGDDTAARLAAIGPRLADFDLVGLQESWDKGRDEALAAAAGQKYVIRFDALERDGTPKVYGSGLTILSKYPFLLTRAAHYSTCFGLADHSSDCLASKGWQMVRLDLGGGVGPDLYDTHFEAGGSEGDVQARGVQVDELLAAMKTYSEGRALIFVGDTNLHADKERDRPMLAKLEAKLKDSCQAVTCPDPNHIDRVFFRGGPHLAISVQSWKDRSADFLDEQGIDLSDHPPIEVGLSWKTQ